MFEFLVNAQRKNYAILSADISAFAKSGDWRALLAVLPFDTAFGVARVLTLGHGKSVLTSYFLGSGLALPAGDGDLAGIAMAVIVIGELDR